LQRCEPFFICTFADSALSRYNLHSRELLFFFSIANKYNAFCQKMKTNLNEVERHRLEKLIWLYCIECGDEGPCGIDGSDIPSATQSWAALIQKDVNVDIDSVEAILDSKLPISEELAAMIEKEFFMPAGWLSN
jgi:hypothetical protein